MLRLDMLIAKNHDLLLYEDIDNLIKGILVDVFLQVHVRDCYTELVRQRLHIQRHRFGLLYFSLGKSTTAFKLPTRPRIRDARYAIPEYQRSRSDRSLMIRPQVTRTAIENKSITQARPHSRHSRTF
jgi:hypothetical protein